MAKTVTLPPRKVRTTVVALQGHPVAPDMPAVGDTLVWDGNEWTPTPAIGRSNRAGETLNLQTTVVGIQGTPVFPVASFLAPGDALLWTGVDWKNYPVAKDLSAANLGPYLPISAYNPGGGGGGDFLPLTGGVLSGPGALTVGDVLTVVGAASAGGNSLVDMQGGSAVVQADGNGLLLQQLGDEYGLTSLLIANRDGLNGAMFTNDGLDLVDFAFQTSSGVTGTLRLDARAIPTGQFSFMLSGNTLLAIDSAGNVNFFGRAILAANAVNPLDAVPLQQLSSTVAGYLPLTGGTLTGTLTRLGVTNGSNAAAGMVGEYLVTSQPSVGISTANWTSMAAVTLTPGVWLAWGFVNYGPTEATTTVIELGLSTVINTGPTYVTTIISGSIAVGAMSLGTSPQIINVTTDTTIYTNVYVQFAGGSANINGFTNALRIR